MVLRNLRNNCPQAGTRGRAGFTLIELLIVIAILAILVAVLVPAVNGVRARARIAQVRMEITALESAVQNFKAKYASEPPSFIKLYEDKNATWDSRSLTLVRQLWPQIRLGTADIDFNDDGTISSTPLEVSQGECLVFFLGGMPTYDATTKTFAVTGFSSNPLGPFTRGGSRVGPFYEFQSRFTDLDGDGMPEYHDPLSASQKPYVYFSSNEGSGYRIAEYGGGGFDYPYLTANPASPSANVDMFKTSTWNGRGHQIISPGFDNEYGLGGAYLTNSTNPLPPVNASLGTAANNARRQYEQDNITNFAENTLGGR